MGMSPVGSLGNGRPGLGIPGIWLGRGPGIGVGIWRCAAESLAAQTVPNAALATARKFLREEIMFGTSGGSELPRERRADRPAA